MLLFFTSLLWGLSFAISKIALFQFSPGALTFARLVLGFLTVAIFQRKSLKNANGGAFVVGIFEFGLMYLLYIESLTYLPSGLVGMLTLLTPVFMAVIGALTGDFLLGGLEISAIFMAILGGFLCFPPGSFSLLQTNGSTTGIVLILLSNISFSIGNIFVARNKRWRDGNSGWGFLVGALTVLLVGLGLNIPLKAPIEVFNLKTLWPVLYLGIIPTGIGFVLWNRGVRKSGLLAAAVYSNLKGPLSLVFGYLILHEDVSIENLFGSFLLFFGAVYLTRKSSLRRSSTKN